MLTVVPYLARLVSAFFFLTSSVCQGNSVPYLDKLDCRFLSLTAGQALALAAH